MGNEANPFGEMDLQLSGDGGGSSFFGGLFSSTNAGGGLFTAENGSNWLGSLGNGSGWAQTALGGSGGIAGMSSFGKAIGNGIQLFTMDSQIDSMVSAYQRQARMAASASRFEGELAAGDYRRTGDAAVKNIGIVQQQGLDSATLRYNALNAEVAAQRVSAAGSGIDLSSRTVGKAEQTARKSAAWDVSRISQKTKIAADSYNAQAETAYRNSAFAQINGEYGAQMAQIQGDLNSSLAEISGKFGKIRAGINLGVNTAKGIADIFSGGMVSAADGAYTMAKGKGIGEV